MEKSAINISTNLHIKKIIQPFQMNYFKEKYCEDRVLRDNGGSVINVM